MRLLSFGRSFLYPVGSVAASPRRVLRAFVAARRRWPSGRLSVGLSGLRWMVPEGVRPPGSELCGLLVHWR